VNYFSSKNEMQKLNATFRMLDRNNDGQLGKDEMKAGIEYLKEGTKIE